MQASDRALSVFRKSPECLNCAQSVCYGSGNEELIEKMDDLSGGRAPEGTCGALYAAMQIVGEQNADLVHDAFVKECGAFKCHELKKELHVPCEKCVSCASELISTCI